MRLKSLHLKLKGIRIRRFLIGNGRKKSRKLENGNKAPWMMHITHGYHVVELDRELGIDAKDFDSVFVQREQINQCELWFFGVFDNGIGEGVTKYMQAHFFDKMPKEIAKLSKQAMKKAHLQARAQLIDREKTPHEAAAWKSGSASAMVIDGEKLVIASMGDYKVVMCRDGEAFEICRKKQQSSLPHWSLKLIPGALRAPKASKVAGGSEIVVGFERIDSETEFVILASSGVWEVMKHQEAVNLIRHIENPQAAAECLATEASTRMSKSNISCFIIRFE